MPTALPVAGLVMVGLPGMVLDPFVRDLIAQGIAGVILFARNVESPAQVAGLADALQRSAAAHGQPPLLIAIDHEGGRVQRLRRGFTALSPAMAFGAAGDPQATYAAGRVAGVELLACGVNMNFAPCADVNSDPANPVIGTRSYGPSPPAVAEHVAAFVRGLQESGVLAVAKHFPGHGATHQDSHFTLPYIDRTAADLAGCELVPFRAAINAGAAGIMSAHIVVPSLTGSLPATLSSAALDVLLRGNLKHNGLVLTDCMEMAAISERYCPEEATRLAVRAGADLVLWSHTPARQMAAIAGLAALAREAEAGGDVAVLLRLHSALARVNAIRHSLCPGGRWSPGKPAAWEGVMPPQQGVLAVWRELASAVPGRAVTLVRGECRLPVSRPGPVLIVTTGRHRRWTDGSEGAVRAAAAAFAAVGYSVTDGPDVSPPAGPSPALERRAADVVACGGTVICLTRDAVLDPGQADEVGRLVQAGGAGAVLVATGLPYEAMQFPGAQIALATYDDSPAAFRRLAEVLAGLARAEGRYPMAGQ